MWEQIRANERKSVMLVAVMAIILLLVGYSLGMVFENPIAGLVIALVVWGIMTLVAYFQGDSILLSSAGAKKISPDDHPRLYNVVEEMKIASGLEKMPDVYIIDDPALNAFATGRDPNRASVAITSGLLQKLSRDELQGVIAHERSHIKNRDVKLMALLAGMLGTIVILAWYASRFLFYSGAANRSRRSSSSSSDGSAQLIIMALAIVLMILAPIFAQIIYFATSRRREYLADASSALYTRYPEGLASALEKLATSNTQVKSANKATAPMYIINPFQKKGMSINDLTSTHPPIAERIRILRAMAGASIADYERAYEQVKGKHVVAHSVLAAAGAGSVSLRQASADTKPVGEATAELERARETSDVLWRKSDYQTIDCDCGTRLRVPSSFRGQSVQCPHCGRIHPVE